MSICRDCDNARSVVRWRDVRKPKAQAERDAIGLIIEFESRLR
jgi:hypothetical protein